MPNKNSNFKPIKLRVKKKNSINFIWRKVYVYAEIIKAICQIIEQSQIIIVTFIVITGKYKGFKLTARFKDDLKGMLRISHLCNSVGITGKLENPSHLIGKKVKLRILPKTHEHMGRKYINHIITRFHPINRDIQKISKK